VNFRADPDIEPDLQLLRVGRNRWRSIAGHKFQILKILYERSPRLVTHREIEDFLWSGVADPPLESRTVVRVTIYQLRSMLPPRFWISSVRGQGYTMSIQKPAIDKGASLTQIGRAPSSVQARKAP
jgi:DNA-binding response OmpR family regulator